MATWYYTRDGAIHGPYSDEIMTELIDSGTVTFVTKVWDADKRDEGREWVYAYDTPLASHFSYEISIDELPDQPETDIPPIPLEPEPLQYEPVQAKPEPPETADTEKKPRESTPPMFLLIAIFIIGLLIGAILSYLTN